MTRDVRPKPVAQRIVRCPTCGGDSVYSPANPHRPFCSDRCRNVDFGAWAAEGYRVPARPDGASADADADSDAG